MPMENLWGEIPVEETIKTPVTFLKEQASILSDTTNKILLGEVKQTSVGYPDSFHYELRITAPALSNYSYSVLRVEHDIKLYPLNVASSTIPGSVQCKNEEEYLAALNKILSSDEVHRVIIHLLSQSRAAA